MLFQVVEDLVDHYSRGRPHHWTNGILDGHRQRLLGELMQRRNAYIELHHDTLLRALHPEITTPPVA